MYPVRDLILALAVTGRPAATSASCRGLRQCEFRAGQFPRSRRHRPGRLTVQVHLPAPGLVERRPRGRDHRRLRVLPRRQHRLSARPRPGRGRQRRLAGHRWRAPRSGRRCSAARSCSSTWRWRRSRSRPSARSEVDFSVPYYRSDIGVMAKAGRGLDLQPLDPGCASGVQAGTTGAAFVGRLQPHRRRGSSATRRRCSWRCSRRRIDVAMTDTAILLSQAAMSGGRFEVIGPVRDRREYGAVYPEGLAQCADARPR